MVQFCYQVQSKLRSQFLGPLCLWQCFYTILGKVGRLEGLKVGRLEGWNVGRSEGWKVKNFVNSPVSRHCLLGKVGKLEGLKVGMLEGWKIGRFK